MTNDPDIRFASSMLDYVFRRLALDHLPAETREGLGIRSIAERTESVHGRARRPSRSRPSSSRSQAPAAPPADDRARATSVRAPRRSTPRCATRAGRRCSRRARATSARAAAARAAARSVARPWATERRLTVAFVLCRAMRPVACAHEQRGTARRAAPRAARDAPRRGGGRRALLRRDPRARRRSRSHPSSHRGAVSGSVTRASRCISGSRSRSPRHKAHPAFVVRDLETLRERIEAAGLPGHRRRAARGFPPLPRARPVRQPDRAGGAEGLMELPFRRLDPEASLPTAHHPGDAGLDLRANVDVEVRPGERVMVPDRPRRRDPRRARRVRAAAVGARDRDTGSPSRTRPA